MDRGNRRPQGSVSGPQLVPYLLQRRSGFRVDERDLVPGHPVYDRLRAEWLREEYGT